MNLLTKILTGTFLVISIGLAFFLYNGVEKVIDDRARIANTENAVIERLKLIRDAEALYHEQFGRYNSNWDSLANFIKNGMVPILQRREEIKQRPYGGEEVTVHIDTLGYVAAWDKIFKKNYTMNATDNGIFMGYKIKQGDAVIKNMKAYSLRVGNDTKEPPFQEKGVVLKLTSINAGDAVIKGKLLIEYVDQIYKDIDLTKLGEVPGNPGTNFNIITKKIDRNGLMVNVIQVVDPKPINPERRESNELKSRKPLRFGSLSDVSTAGNWE